MVLQCFCVIFVTLGNAGWYLTTNTGLSDVFFMVHDNVPMYLVHGTLTLYQVSVHACRSQLTEFSVHACRSQFMEVSVHACQCPSKKSGGVHGYMVHDNVPMYLVQDNVPMY